MPEPLSEMKADPVRAPNSELSEEEQADLRDHAIRAARSCAWLHGRRACSKPREIFVRSARDLSRLEQDLYNLKSGVPSDDLTWLYDNLRLVRTDIQDLHDSAKNLS